MYLILVILLVLALCGSYPAYSYNQSWGYGPVGGVGLILIILLVLLFARRI